MIDRLQKILAVASESDGAELKTAHNANVIAMRAHGTAPSAATVANKNATREDFEATLSRLEGKYFPEEQPAPEGERFANRVQALNWLRAQGYKISQGKFYQDCKAGFPFIHRDGTISRYQTMQYGQQLDVSARSVPQFDQSARREDLEIRKLAAEVEEKELKARREDARWMNREDAWAAVAALLSTAMDNLRHELYEGQGLVLHVACGGLKCPQCETIIPIPDRGIEVFEATMEMVGKGFADLAGARIEGMFAEIVDEKGEADEQ